MANISAASPAISSTSSGISSPSGSRANTPRIYNKRASEYGEENGFKRRKQVIPSNMLKTAIPANTIVVSADHILPGTQTATLSQLGINTTLPSHHNMTQLGSFYQFPIMVQAPVNHTAILQAPNLPALIAQTLTPVNSTTKEAPQIRLPKHIRPLVLLCVGNLLETQTQSLPGNIGQSSIFKDICDGIIPTANRSWKACLSPESLAIFIVNYLTSVSNGGILMKEVLETMLSYAKMGEQEWMQVYYHYSNNNVWKIQVSHFARLAAYQSNSNVMIMSSQISLVSGVNNALQSLADLKKMPDFIVVLYSPQGNKPFEFCVIVLNACISKMIQEQERSTTNGNMLNILKYGGEERLKNVLHKRSQMLKNRALPPFKTNNLQAAVYCSDANLEKISPQTSNIVEYQPRGPFRQQEITAMTLLKKVKDLQNSNSDTAYLSNYTSVEYYIFVPTTSTLYWQTVERLAESNLIKEAIKARFGEERVSSISIAQNHIIKFDFTQIANPQLIELINFVKANTNTLFVCVQDNAHAYTTFANASTQQNNNQLIVPSPCLIYLQLLHMPNVLSIAVTSSPVSLLSSLSCIPTENEVDWFEESDITPCIYPLGASYQDLESILEENTDIKLVEDNVFEDKIEVMCSQSRYEKNKFDVIRAQLLIQEYTIAQLRLTGHTKNLNCTGETFTMLHGLVEQPMSNNYGYGPMIVLRVHDKDVGKFVYDQLISVRKDVGLRYRYEIILDDGNQDLNIDPYFVKRMRTWKFGKQSSDIGAIKSSYFSSLMIQQSTWTPKTYLQLNNLPCILIISGKERGGETLPKSVSHYDLRLLSGISVTSHTLTVDLGYIHRYVNSNKAKKRDQPMQSDNRYHMCASPILTQNTATPNHENVPTFEFIKQEISKNEIDKSLNLENSRSVENIITKETELKMSAEEFNEQIDVSTEIKNSISPVKSPNSQTSNHSSTSHSSNEKFLIKHLTAKPEPISAIQRMDTDCTVNSDEVQDGASSGRNSVISNFSDPEINTTPIQRDVNQDRANANLLRQPSKTIHYTNNGISAPQLSSSMPHTIKYLPMPIQSNAFTMLHSSSNHLNSSMNSLNSREDNWSDVDEDDDEDIGIPDYYDSFTCLLSRPYKNILTSKFATLNTRDLLPPSRDMVFEDNPDRTPQNNSKDFKQISKYHRQWAKPCANHIDNVRATLIAKQQVGYPEHIASRFLLTGPPQVGKTGAYILFIKLLQDLVHSSNFVKIYDKFENESSNTVLNGTNISKDTTNFALPKTIEILKSKFDPNAINLYQHEKLSSITYLEGNASPDIQASQASAFHLVKNLEDYDSNFLYNPSSTSINVKQEVTPQIGENSFNKLSPSKFNDSYPLKADCFSVIQQLPDLAYAYDKSHTCAKCVAFYSHSNHLVHELAYLMNNGQGPKLKFFIPHHHLTSFEYTSNMVITRLVLAVYERDQSKKMNKDNFLCRTPIFTPSTGRAMTGLFNLAHVLKHQVHTHIIVVNENEVNEYRKHWPTHIIMAVPDTPEYYSLGGVMELIKQFSTENVYINERSMMYQQFIIWPYILMLSDSCLMFKSTPAKIQPPTSTPNNRITLFDILKHIELDPEFTKYGAISIRQWTSKSIPENNFSKCFLNTNFLYLHIPMVKDVHFDHFSHTCIAADITLKMLAFGIPFCRINHFSYIKKFIKLGGESFSQEVCKSTRSTLLSNPEKFIGIPDSDKASSVLYSGSYIMEAFLQKVAKEIFPLASSSEFPVLEINKFLNLSENTFVSFVHEKTFQTQEQHKTVRYGGLLMFSSEILQDAYFLKQFQFAQGATICLVTSDHSNLRKEITRLNLEDSWRFKIRDEFYTLCAPEKQPLYFYTGRYDVVQDSN